MSQRVLLLCGYCCVALVCRRMEMEVKSKKAKGKSKKGGLRLFLLLPFELTYAVQGSDTTMLIRVLTAGSQNIPYVKHLA